MLWLKLLVGADGSKLHSNRVKAWAEKTQPAVSLIDGFAEFVTHAGPSDAAASEMKYFRLPFFFVCFFYVSHRFPPPHPRPPPVNNDCSCVNVASSCVCAPVCVSLFWWLCFFLFFFLLSVCICVCPSDYGAQIGHYPCVRRRGA